MNLKSIIFAGILGASGSFGQDTTVYYFNCPDALKLYSIEEIHTVGTGIVDLNRSGKIDIGDAFFVGRDKNMDGNSDIVYIHPIMKLDGCHADLNPAEVWFDMDHDGEFDIKIPSPTLEEIYKEDSIDHEYSGNHT